MSLAYCNKCLERIDQCDCPDGSEEPFIYGEISRAVEADRRERDPDYLPTNPNKYDST